MVYLPRHIRDSLNPYSILIIKKGTFFPNLTFYEYFAVCITFRVPFPGYVMSTTKNPIVTRPIKQNKWNIKSGEN